LPVTKRRDDRFGFTLGNGFVTVFAVISAITEAPSPITRSMGHSTCSNKRASAALSVNSGSLSAAATI
jgi:hypothetical protein